MSAKIADIRQSDVGSSGGWKHSGLGRERGIEGIRAFQQTKHLSVAGPS